MHSTISKRFGAGLIILLTAVCFIPAVAGTFTPGGGRQEKGFGGKGIHPPALGIWRNPQMVQKLEITEEQIKELRVYVMTHKGPHPGPGDKRIPRRHGMERPFEK